MNGRKDLAGKIIAVGSGTNQEKILVGWNDANVAEGLAPIDIKYFQNSTDYYLALSSGRIDGYFGPNPTAQYHVASAGETKVIGTFSGAGDALQGEIAVLTKKDNGLVKAFADAINHTIENGTYQQVLDRWNLASEAVTDLRGQPARTAEDGQLTFDASKDQPIQHRRRGPHDVHSSQQDRRRHRRRGDGFRRRLATRAAWTSGGPFRAVRPRAHQGRIARQFADLPARLPDASLRGPGRPRRAAVAATRTG